MFVHAQVLPNIKRILTGIDFLHKVEKKSLLAVNDKLNPALIFTIIFKL